MANIFDDLFSGGGGSASSGSGSGTTTTGAQIPGWLYGLISRSGKDWVKLLKQAMPGLESQLGAHPEQTAQLSPQELQIISQLQSGTFGMNAPGISNAYNQLSQLTSGPIGQSPDTLAAMRAYNMNAAPAVANDVALTGAGRGGADIAALSQGQEAAYVPLIQQEIANRANAVNQYGQLATDQSQLGTTALQAADLPRQIQQQSFDAAYQDLLRRYGLEQEAVLGPLQQFGGGLFGSTSTTTSNQNSNQSSSIPLF